MVIGVCRLLTVRSGPVDDAQLFRSAGKRNKFWKSCGNYQKRSWKPLLSSCGSWTNSVCACQTCLPCKMAGLVRPGQEKTRRRRCPTLPNLPSRGAHRWKWARFCWEKGERHTAMSCILQAFACLEASQPKGSPWEIWSRYSCPYVYQPGADAQTNSSGFGTRQGLKQLVRDAIDAVQGERSAAGAVELRLPFPSFCGRSLTRTVHDLDTAIQDWMGQHGKPLALARVKSRRLRAMVESLHRQLSRRFGDLGWSWAVCRFATEQLSISWR